VPMSYKNILMVVEANFNTNHIGVRRVISYHFKNLVARGHNVILATHRDGHWVGCSLLDATRAILEDVHVSDTQPPYWKTGDGYLAEPAHIAPQHQSQISIQWDGPKVRPEDFDESILTNPWLCAVNGEPITDGAFSVGIVYDMVPNLIALGCLRMPQFLDIYRFAEEHHIGYEYFLRNAKTISCISESTRRDFLALYGSAVDQQVDVCIPFGDFGGGSPKRDPSATDVLMINVLDQRKNFSTAAKALKEASMKTRLHVVIVGRERLPWNDVMKFLVEISAVCASVRWYRSPSDIQIQELMTHAKVVFFPSFYEGLGLPILESQARGVPVVSSNNSSCGEINLSDGLTADPYDYHAQADLLVGVLSGTLAVPSGQILRDRQLAFLSGKNQFFVLDNPVLEAANA